MRFLVLCWRLAASDVAEDIRTAPDVQLTGKTKNYKMSRGFEAAESRPPWSAPSTTPTLARRGVGGAIVDRPGASGPGGTTAGSCVESSLRDGLSAEYVVNASAPTALRAD
jgi:hypothetical protein